jgi:hypothetical protein
VGGLDVCKAKHDFASIEAPILDTFSKTPNFIVILMIFLRKKMIGVKKVTILPDI